jgi:BirA family biotin operon repressor/biotin-[acetyl-CoA-carboxylase] ligase
MNAKPTPVLWQIKKLELTASTNDDAKQEAERGAPEGLVIHATQQTAGRGRHGRVWESPAGNLYTSIVLRPEGTLSSIGFFSFVVALAISDTIRDYLPPETVSLKWPNDVLVNGKKISGILLESGDGYLVIGIGINVAHYPAQTLYPTTSLVAESPNTVRDVDSVLQNLLKHLAVWYTEFQHNGFLPIRDAWQKRAGTGRVQVKTSGQNVDGDFVGIDLNGCLRIRLADGTDRTFSTGDVFIR